MLTTGKLGFWGLTALVFGLVVGVGIYNLPQNMASVASPGAVILSWLITSAGILPLVILFKWLSNNYPQYNAGLYQYAQAEFGNYAGFNIAWGYWLCTAFSNVTYGVMLNDSFGALFPALLKHGWETVVFGSILIWIMYFLVVSGVKTAKIVNTILAAIKIVMLIFIISVFIIFFKAGLFDTDFWGTHGSLGPLHDQVKGTMMVTLFCFFGVEGAVMMSARAKRASDVGKAGIVGFIIAVVLYLCVSVLCYGLLSRSDLAGLYDPSIAYILRSTCGEWAYWFVISAVIVALLGGWVAWTLVVAQVPYEAAVVRILPKRFLRLNSHDMPSYGLMASSIAMEFFLIMVVMADDMYMTALRITGLMIIPCYFFTGLFAIKKADTPFIKCTAWIATLFCVWMAYAGGIMDMIVTSLFYLLGTGFFIAARREYKQEGHRIFNKKETYALFCLIVLSVASVIILTT